MRIKAKIKDRVFTLNLIQKTDKTLSISSIYNPDLVEELKCLKGARWDPENKVWTVDDDERNLYSLFSLERNDPRFNPNLVEESGLTWDVIGQNELYKHQRDILLTIKKVNQTIIAGEMGVGKTLAAIEAMEAIKGFWWIIAPKSAIHTWESEFKKWKNNLTEAKNYILISYSRLEKYVLEDEIKPDHIIFDEAHLLKNPKAKRTQAALLLTAILRAKDKNACVVLLTGTPNPKDPTDWWSLTELCQPGYLRESTKIKLGRRLGVWETKIGQVGQEYPQLIQWKNNELIALKRRLEGMVLTILKKDCLDLPDKIYIQEKLPCSEEQYKQINLLLTLQGKGVQTLQKLRQLSDGFQYHQTCIACSGRGKIERKGIILQAIPCKVCLGTGEMVSSLITPKDEQLKNDLTDLEANEKNRVVIYAAYQHSIDKVCSLCNELGWTIIKLDGRGLVSGLNKPFEAFADKEILAKIAFIGHPKAGGLGLNLQAAELLIFYSSDFDGAARPQAEDRIHRIGTTKAVIKDYLWLPTDYYILENLRKKRSLQGVTVGEIKEFVDDFEQKEYWKR